MKKLPVLPVLALVLCFGFAAHALAFTTGDRVQTTSKLNIRSSAGANGKPLGTQPLGAKGSLVGGPQTAKGYTWWNINFDTGADGWAVQDYLTDLTTVTPTPTPTPVTSTTTPPPPPPTITGGTYSVYPGCESPATSYARTLYFDPTNGSDTTGDGSAAKPYQNVEVFFHAQKVQGGDHIVLLPGTHAPFYLNKYQNAGLVGNPTWIWIEYKPGAVSDNLSVNDVSRVLITGATLTHPAGALVNLFSTASASQVVLADSSLYTDLDSSTWSADKWINGTANGVSSDDSHCVSILRNHITNVRFALTVFTRATSTDPAVNSIKVLVQDNIIQNFSGDGIRPLGSDVTIYHNGIYDEYVGAAEGDANHDDGMQGFALPDGTVYGNVVIDHNWVQESTNPNRLHNAEMQGISCFDGIYTNSRVTNNVVLTSAYHGISWYGVNNFTIDHNTVLNPTANGHKLWIYMPAGSAIDVPYNNTMSNNIAEYINTGTPGTTITNNAAVYGIDPTTLFTAFDPVNNRYDLHIKAGSILDGKNQGSDLTGPITGPAVLAQAETHSNIASNGIAHFDLLAAIGAILDQIMQFLLSIHF